ncbi:GNAT family N-acetyltransferase [Bosea sp. (in: a-proteobacteria)]|uniref:lipid II:glycine glycyltransferase FemX n=1 Tax=Bosea sp. (in: a-proteobacteria) TaxID=1871050 RepID=UPI00261956C2|nr:GNAT family N-acetyltransferase [Bosea sp. (in: a-proteobacteria)]MCO5090655.1 GNAT family N-acetyltransferase [Bosea sp. (in: a-proteobacteria)]
MKTLDFGICDHEAWDDLVLRSPDAWLTHRADWVKIEARFFASANLSFAVEDRGKLVACLPLYLSDAATGTGGEILVHSGIHRHAGLVLAPDLEPASRRQIQTSALKHVEALAALADADRIQMSQSTLAPGFRAAQRAELPFWVSEFGYQLGVSFSANGMWAIPGLSTVAADQQVDLAGSDDVLFERLDPACRRAIRKAQQNDLTFSCGYGSAELDRYFALARRSAERTREPLPPLDYYTEVLTGLAEMRGAGIAFAHHRGEPVAGLIFLGDRGAVSYLAGVSEPAALHIRPNDFLHWSFMLWARDQGCDVYRLGPSFPEVPADWPISRISQFKTKFGGRAVPMVQGSLYRKPQAYVATLSARLDELAELSRSRAGGPVRESVTAEALVHQLSLVGLDAGQIGATSRIALCERPSAVQGPAISRALAAGRAVVAVLPCALPAAMGVTVRPKGSPARLTAASPGAAWEHLRSFHPVVGFEGEGLIPLVTDADGTMIWAFRPDQSGGGLFLIGTDLAADLTLIRQGRPEAANSRPTQAQWGFAGERPNYLFEQQIDADAPHERMADWWLWALRDALARHAGLSPRDVLPGGAPGAIVITGDDDQAPLSAYAMQAEMLGDLPITYFLHPLTKHDRASLEAAGRGRKVEFGLHPDALDAPDRYGELFDEQAAWFEKLTGAPARSVRNHGFLNDGYWGHASSWIRHGVAVSSNLPGLDGRVINGSLLPGRLLLNGQLTEHWSILTAIGDGVVFVHGWDDAQSADCVRRLADRIRKSGVPGVIVLNLHPENVAKTKGLHDAALELVREGFVAWTLQECIDWFAGGNETSQPATTQPGSATGGPPPGSRKALARLKSGMLRLLRNGGQ